MNSFTIASRELRSLFLSPLAWTILGVSQLILAYMFLTQIDYYLAIQPKLIGIPGAPGVTDLIVAPLFGNAAVILLLIIPLLTMRTISDERRNKTISLLFSAPVSLTEIVLGKFLAIFAFLLIILLSITLMPLSLLTVGELDIGKLFACLLAMVLLMASFNALGLYMSAIASQPTVAAIGSFGALLLLWIIDWAGNSSSVLEYISIMRHFENLLRGLIHSTDIFYFILFIAGFLILSIRRLDNDRLQK
ncbi:MAG: ABC-2 type transport system permease protein [Cycloclasticus pugetii]|jgi:ABC-2 type transport system permease protein|uniref:ABC-type transport system involved in multi-copper enzyme maturation, permease component n=2 Tax=Cycloclasticus TaxID=34067 RepID=S5T597_9GAMM|nr:MULTISPECIES: ABC transporter permease subunit [Cycloclasticus]AFT67828.1 ABC transporter, permease protein [Cycloclasticus sp. P1]AGS39001.1 ABC-type transport system involved in multi-copper enzyme maturation, permease component [Cycloclasticus zancles 78-ME]ATI02629.1 ABC transporter permease [Cycloclasticus sp. PY97N]EPD12805.1 ABC transporter permease [Cycloclasticus pugetii]MBV1899084.1 ABC transporter permease subunit [Cycloclasticus sp.]